MRRPKSGKTESRRSISRPDAGGGRHIRRAAVWLLLAGLILLGGPETLPAQALAGSNPWLKIGLAYSSSSMESANLQNVTGYGSGYAVGTMDAGGNFIQYGTIQEKQITMQATSSTGFAITRTTDGYTLFTVDLGGEDLCVQPLSVSGEKPQTWFRGYYYYGSFIYRRNNDGKLTVINYLQLEDYVKGVIPYEMNANWPIEALKAQAYCARTYAVANIGYHNALGFDLCNSTDCQVYQGAKEATAQSDRAVDETAGMFITYGGQPIQAVYHASNGGATENSENVWHEARPYLRAVRDDWEAMTTTTYTSWTYEISAATLTRILQTRGNDIAQIVHAYAEYTAAGNVKKLVFIDANGKRLDYEGESARIMLRSTDYGIGVSSQRFIFEDAANPRITSVNALQKPPAGSLTGGGSGVLPGFVNPATDYVLSAAGMESLQKYGGNFPVLTAGGVQYQSQLQVSGGAQSMNPGTSSQTNSGAGIDPSTLIIPTSSSGRYLIMGGGNGHNVGMSQFGAKAMAEQGYAAAQIINYYYTGVTLTSMYW